MRRYGLILVFVNILSIAFGQEIKTTWLLDYNHLITFGDSNVHFEPFDFIQGYEINGDSLFFKHDSPATVGQRCTTFNEKGEVIRIICQDWSIPDSQFLITKITTDSLFLMPVNNSAIAISNQLKQSTQLKYRYNLGMLHKIAENADTGNIDYFEIIRFHNISTLYEDIKWDTIAVSHTTNGWWGIYYFDIQIMNNGNFLAKCHYKPFKERKPNKDQRTKTTYYKDSLPPELTQKIKNELNNSGIKTVEKIDFQGWSSHGREITLKVSMRGETKLLTAYEYCFPYTLKSLIKTISDLDKSDGFKTTDSRFSIETSFINKKNK